jgi:hypothetical protein
VDTEICCPKGKCGCLYFILLTFSNYQFGFPVLEYYLAVNLLWYAPMNNATNSEWIIKRYIVASRKGKHYISLCLNGFQYSSLGNSYGTHL